MRFDQWAEQWVHERSAKADAARFAEIERFCLSVGFARSGGSLVGALLNAHPDTVIGQELGAPRKVGLGYSKEALHAAVMPVDRQCASRGWSHQGFDYEVPGQWQGRVRQLRVIGDKHAESSSSRLADDPTLIEQLRRTVGIPVRIVVVVRHPLDNIAHLARRGLGSVMVAAARYDQFARSVEHAPAEAGDDAFVVDHEGTVADPAASLRRPSSRSVRPTIGSRPALRWCSRVIGWLDRRSNGARPNACWSTS